MLFVLKKYARGFSIAGAVCFIIMSVLLLLSIINLPHFDLYNVSNFVSFVGCIITAIGLIRGRKNILFIIGTATLSLSSIYNIIEHFNFYLNYTDDFNNHILYNVCDCLTDLAVILIFIIALFTYFPVFLNKNGILKKLWFIPTILFAIFSVVKITAYIRADVFLFNPLDAIFSGFSGVLYYILAIFAYFGLGIWITSDLYETYDPTIKNNIEYSDNFANAGFNLAGHIILMFLFGIWQYFWVYRTTKHLNADKTEEYRSPAKKLLLYIFVPFYSIYWVYMSCQRIDNLSKQRGLTSNISTLCVIFSIFMPFVSWIVMQSRINKICKMQPINVKSDNAISDFDKLREYKALLDDGVITQEEFEKKKKEII